MAKVDFTDPRLHPFGRFGINNPQFELPGGKSRKFTPQELASRKGEDKTRFPTGAISTLAPRRTDELGFPPGQSFLDTERAKQFAPGGISAERGAVDTEAIRERERGQAQAQIDAIDEIYNRLIAGERLEGQDRLGRARALASKGGTLTSTIYTQGQRPKIKAETADVIAGREAERGLAIAGILDRVNENTKLEAAAETERRKGNAEGYLRFLEDSQISTRESIAGLAQNGVSFDTLTTDPEFSDELANLLKFGGFKGTWDLEAYFNNNKPKEEQIDYTEKTFRGENGNAWILRYGNDPVTGELKTYEGDLGISYDNFEGKEKVEIRESGGEFWLFDSATNTMKLIGGRRTSTAGTSQQKNYASYVADEKAAGRTPLGFLAFSKEFGKADPTTDDPVITKDLRDAQAALDGGADPDKVRQRFLETHPTKGSLFLNYFKYEF